MTSLKLIKEIVMKTTLLLTSLLLTGCANGLPELSTSTTKVGKVYENETLTTIGYPVGLPLASTQGNYVGEIDVDNWDCTMSASTNVTMGGMSGGGVFNDKGELVGVVHGFISGDVVWSSKSVKSPSVFLSLYAVKGWLTEMTGVEYFL